MSRKEDKDTEGKPPLYPLRKAVKGYVPESFRIPITTILKFGHIRELLATMERRRGEVGLDSVPPTAYKHEKALKEFQELITSSKFDELIGYDRDRKRLKY